MVALVVFILILSILVLVHEFGHFIVSKKLGIRVEEFGLGIPPRVFGKQIGETLYSLNWLPFGGFVKVTGEDIEESVDDKETQPAAKSILSDPRSFAGRPPIQRIAVLCAGVVMNLILAVALFYIVLIPNNYQTQYIPMIFEHHFKFGQEHILGTVVTDLMADSSAEKSGIQIGEAILTIDGRKINNVYDLRDSLKGKLGQDVEVVLKDVRTEVNGKERTLKMKPQTDDKGNAILGVYVTKAVSLSYDKMPEKLFAGFLHSYNVLEFSITSFAHLIGLSYAERSVSPVSQSVAGPVGIYRLVGGLIDYGGAGVIYRILDFTALLSVSLAFINILPFPALDGGRALFVVIEKIKGKPLSPKIEAALHRIGFAILLSLIVLVTIKDILH